MIPDECEGFVECGSAGSTPDGRFVAGRPLKLDKTPGVDISLEWGVSCLADDTDYAVYEGTIGDFTHHSARLCTTEGLTTADLIPDPTEDGSYYLVVPLNGTHEGSYGLTSEGVERPTGQPVPCLPQEIGTCFGLPSSPAAD
jgi:hypothetical protein